MFHIIKYLKEYKLPVLCIVVLLFIQAFCDLSLPTYTSQLVDVGIAKKGIEETIPKEIKESDLQKLQMFVPDDKEELVQQSYEKTKKKVQEETIYKLTAKAEKLEEVSETLKEPIALFGMLSAMQGEEDAMGIKGDNTTQASSQMVDQQKMQELITAMMNPQTEKTKRIELLDETLSQFGDLKDTMLDQMIASYIKAEYQSIGLDLDQIQINYLVKTGLKMLLLSFIVLVVAISVGAFASQIAAKTAMNLRNRVFRKVVSFSNAEMDQYSTASLITRNTNDIQQIQMVLVMLLRMVLYAPILGIGGIIKVLGTNASLSWIIVAAVATLICLVAVLFIIAIPKFKLMQTLVDKVNLVSREILTGLPVIRAFSTEAHEEKRFDKANTELASTQLFTNRVMTFMMPLMMFLMNLVSVGIIWFGSQKIDMGTLQVGEMMAFLTYAMQIIMSFLMITMISIMLPRAGVAAKRVDEVIDTEITINDKKATNQKPKDATVVYDHVSFAYPNAEGDVLHDITFTAKPGETTAFIGSTGSGKSTLINLLPRFYDVTAGSVCVGGVNIEDMPLKNLRDMLGYVPQKGVLFSGTIESNIKYGAQDIDENRVKKAAEIAQSIEFIDAKPKGYDSEISQGGSNVSGGQKQRLSIARAIAKKPDIYVFDDSFSALDFKTDVALRKALQEETKDSVVLIVAQRISTILNAEQIIVLDEGRMVGKGTHTQLLQHCEVYQQIAMSQLSEAELRASVKEDELDEQ